MENSTIKCPQWLVDRMEALKKLPPPTLEQVKTQWEYSAKYRSENAGCHKHKEYAMINPPETDCYHCWTAYCDRQQTYDAIRLFWEAMDKYDRLQS